MHLAQLVPPLATDLVERLSNIGIKSDADLLFSSRNPLHIFRKLQQGDSDKPHFDTSLKEFNEMLSQVTERAAATPIYADDALELETRRQADLFADDISVGVPALDQLLGGLSPPRLLEISGDSGSGKTAVALHVVLRHLTRLGDTSALWIDSTGEFSPERASEILDRMAGQFASTALERLQVSLTFDIETVHDVLEALRQALSSDALPGPTPRCIVIDTITPLLGPMLSATSSQGHAVMTMFMRQLRAFADSFSLTILVINNSASVRPQNPESVFTMSRKPALGPSFTFLSDGTLWLARRPEEEHDDGATVHVAEMFRSRYATSNTWCRFKIKEGVLFGFEP